MKKRVKLKVVLSLLLAVAIIAGTLPIGALAENVAAATAAATPVGETEPAQEPGGEESASPAAGAAETGEPAESEAPQPAATPSAAQTSEPGASSSPSAAPSVSPSPSPSAALESSISGTVWNDANANGVREEDEPGIAGYAVELQRGTQKVQTVLTDASGGYRFAGLAAGQYRVGVKAGVIGGTEYLVPVKSIQAGADNKFDADFSAEEAAAYSDTLTLGAGSA